MKRASTRGLVYVCLLLLVRVSAFPQGTFQNLDFEGASIVLDPASPFFPLAVAASNGLPGWTAYGGTFLGDILYDDVSLGAAAISIHDTNRYIPIVQGEYTVLLQGSFPGGAVIPAIGQVGTVPSDARSITYLGQSALTVTFGGQPISIVPIGSGPNYTIFGGDISAFAGQTGELRLQGGGFLDNISFSQTEIPEPSMAAIMTISGVMLGCDFLRRLRTKPIKVPECMR